MRSRKTYNPCFCTFIPPYVLDRLSKASDTVVDEKTRQAAQASLNQDNQFRAARASQAAGTPTPGDMLEGVMSPPKGTASREVYSCACQWGEL